MKKIMIAIFLIAAMTVAVACGNDYYEYDGNLSAPSETSSVVSSEEVKSSAVAFDMSLYGNLPANIKNGGKVAFKDGKIVFRNDEDGGKIYVCDLAAKTMKKVSDAAAGHYINIDGEFIYYVNADKVCRVKFDGSENAVVYEGRKIASILLYSGTVYAIDADKKLVSFPVGGGEAKLLYEQGASLLDITADGVCFVNAENKLVFLKVADLSTRVLDINAKSYVYNNGWVYYCDADDQGKLTKIREDGTSKIVVAPYSSDYVNLSSEGILYYCNLEANNHLTRVTINGEDRNYVTQDKSFCVYLAGDYVICQDMASQMLRIVKNDKKTPFDLIYIDEWL